MILKGKFIEDYTKALNDMRKALQVSVKIDHEEVLKIVVRDLIDKRNSAKGKSKDSFDDVLMYYLGAEDFEKYVINNKEI